jgi:threonine/homoserine/homoserine lactone efflux protein
MDQKAWWPISRQIYADVAKNGKPDRIDTFNGNYGLNRGLAAATFALACVAAMDGKWFMALVLLVLTVVYDYRAYRFGVYYGRELYLQFLVLNDATAKNTSSRKPDQET